MVRSSSKAKAPPRREIKIPEEFDLYGKTTKQHIMAGNPSDPGACAEHLAVVDAWQLQFSRYPSKVYVDKERIQVKDGKEWFWGPPAPQQIRNLLALDETRRYDMQPCEWKVSFIKKCDVVPMSKETIKKLQDYNKDKKKHGRRPTTRVRIAGLTRMIKPDDPDLTA
jgi:hypothetical protein